MRAILIDAVEKTVTEIDTDGKLESLYRLIGCDLVEPVQMDDRHSLWIDEEGLLKADPGPFFAFRRIEDNPFPKKGVILGETKFGKMCDAVVPLEAVEREILWPDIEFVGFEEFQQPGVIYASRAVYRKKEHSDDDHA